MDEIDRIFVAEETVSPSTGFATGVMDAIAAATAEPPPLPFPWGRFTTGVLACAVWAACGVWLVEAELPQMDVAVAALSAVQPELEIATGTTFATLAALRVRRTLSE